MSLNRGMVMYRVRGKCARIIRKASVRRLLKRYNRVNPRNNSRTESHFIFKTLRKYRRYKIGKNGFWFVDIPKTSTASIRTALVEKYDVLSPGGPTRELLGAISAHVPASEMRHYLGPELWDKVFTFALVRNPWSRAVSFYFHLKTRRKRNFSGFKDYVNEIERYYTNSPDLPPHAFIYHAGNWDFVTDGKGNIIVDYVGRFENRDEDLAYIGTKINCDLRKFHFNAAPQGRPHYSEFYDDESIEIVRQAYAKDIEMFGYKFEKK